MRLKFTGEGPLGSQGASFHDHVEDTWRDVLPQEVFEVSDECGERLLTDHPIDYIKAGTKLPEKERIQRTKPPTPDEAPKRRRGRPRKIKPAGPGVEK